MAGGRIKYLVAAAALLATAGCTTYDSGYYAGDGGGYWDRPTVSGGYVYQEDYYANRREAEYEQARRDWYLSHNGRCDDARYETSNGGRSSPFADERECRRYGDGLKGADRRYNNDDRRHWDDGRRAEEQRRWRDAQDDDRRRRAQDDARRRDEAAQHRQAEDNERMRRFEEARRQSEERNRQAEQARDNQRNERQRIFDESRRQAEAQRRNDMDARSRALQQVEMDKLEAQHPGLREGARKAAEDWQRDHPPQ